MLPTAVAITLPVMTARRLDLGTLVEGRRSDAGDWGDVGSALGVGDAALPSPVGRIGAVPGRAADVGGRCAVEGRERPVVGVEEKVVEQPKSREGGEP